MPLEVGLWRVDGDTPVKVIPSGFPLESQLERMVETDPTILGTPLLLIGRQVPTDYGKFIDLLAVDDDGTQLVARILGARRITRADVRQHSAILGDRILASRFGSWNAAEAAAGLDVSPMGRRWSDDDYFENPLQVWTHHGRPPTHAEMNQPGGGGRPRPPGQRPQPSPELGRCRDGRAEAVLGQLRAGAGVLGS
jgi:hypothetical protein